VHPCRHGAPSPGHRANRFALWAQDNLQLQRGQEELESRLQQGRQEIERLKAANSKSDAEYRAKYTGVVVNGCSACVALPLQRPTCKYM
jgi:uncharacterized small protein (DUF1192 family)